MNLLKTLQVSDSVRMSSWIVDQFLSHDWRFRRRKWNGEQQFKIMIEYDVHNYCTEAI